MKFNMLRNGIDIIVEQDDYKKQDRRKIHKTHSNYVFLSNIPESATDEELLEAFNCFALKMGKGIKYFTRVSDYFCDLHFKLDDKAEFWTIEFRFDEFRLGKEYEIDTDAVEEDTLSDTANNTPPSDGNAVYSALVAGSNNDFI